MDLILSQSCLSLYACVNAGLETIETVEYDARVPSPMSPKRFLVVAIAIHTTGLFSRTGLRCFERETRLLDTWLIRKSGGACVSKFANASEELITGPPCLARMPVFANICVRNVGINVKAVAPIYA